MARKPVTRPRRDDWAEVETFELSDGTGRRATRWQNQVTNETATLAVGVHPIDNANAVALQASQVLASAALASDVDDGFDDAAGEESAADRVETFLRGAQGAERANVHISRIKPDGKSHCETISADEFETLGLDGLRSKYGAGKFELMLYATNPESGKYVRRGVRVFEIEEIKQDKSAPAVPSELMRLIDRMDQRMSALETAPRVDPMDAMKNALTMMTLMREAMGLNAQQAPQQAPQSATSAIKEIAAVLGVIKEIRAEIEPPSERETDPMMEALKSFAPVLSSAMQNQAQPMPQIQVPQIAAPVHQVPQQNPVVESTPPDEDAMQNQLIVFWLTSCAKANADIEETAETIYDKSPPEVLTMIAGDDWWQMLLQMSPQFEPHKAYFEKLRTRVVEIIAEENAADQGPETRPAA